jgi:3-dehydroquinate synthase
MAEAVKVALIRERGFFEWLEAKAEALALFASEPLDRLIRHCAILHMRQIAHGGDPFERGSVRPLDFGHWAAHKLEGLSDYELRHGEAVAIGIALDTRYSVLAGLLPHGQDTRVRALLERLGFVLWHPACEARDADGRLRLLGGLEEFRAHLGGELTITLLEDIGTGVEVHTMDESLIVAALDWLKPARGV